MNFGVPSKNKKKEEKYPNLAVFTLAIEGPKGTAKTMSFNTKACELLGLAENKAAIAFSFENKIVNVMNAAQVGIPDEYAINVTKTEPRRISDKRTYEYIAEVLSLDTSIENEFLLDNKSEKNGITFFGITPLNAIVKEVEAEVEVETIANEVVEDTAFDANDIQTDNSDVNFEEDQAIQAEADANDLASLEALEAQTFDFAAEVEENSEL